jgi:tetratricopeptide (TPR) repeat protein
MREEEIKKMVDKAKELSKRGHNKAAIQLLREAWYEVKGLPAGRARPLKGSIRHYQGIAEQAMGQHGRAVKELEYALGYRKDSTVDYAYIMFQLFDCKVDGDIPITDEEVEETKMALGMALVDDAATNADIGNFLLDISYIEQTRGNVDKAIVFYTTVLGVQQKVNDNRKIALAQIGLAECNLELGEKYFANVYANQALRFFLTENDKKGTERVRNVLEKTPLPL